MPPTPLQIREANPKLGRAARVLTTSMDRVYAFSSAPPGASGTEGVLFRLVPDPTQVRRALELYEHAGVAAGGGGAGGGFQGVPLFQAEGLTIKGDKSRYTPLFFRWARGRGRGRVGG